MVIKKLNNPFAPRAFDTSIDVIKVANDSVYIVAKFGVGGSKGAFAINDDSGDAILLGHCRHSQTRFGRCTWNAYNMPQLFIDFRFLNTIDAKKAKCSRRWWQNLLHGWIGLLNTGEESSSPRSCDSLIKAWAREVNSAKAVHLVVSSNWSVGLVLLQSKHLGSFEVWIASAKILSTKYVKKGPLQRTWITSLLSTTLNIPLLELFFVGANSSDITLQKLKVCHNLDKSSNVVINNSKIKIASFIARMLEPFVIVLARLHDGISASSSKVRVVSYRVEGL